MIRVERPAAPDWFHSKDILEAKEELKMRSESSSQERLRFNMEILRPVREPLGEMFRDKCAYCESPLYGEMHIDSFRPKSGSRELNGAYSFIHYWWLAYEWTNLYPSCSTCNRHKTDLFPIAEGFSRARPGAEGKELMDEKALLIDPCLDNPEEHLSFDMSGMVKGLTQKGAVTIEVLGLNRPELAGKRREAAEALMGRLELLLKEPFDTQPLFKEELDNILSGMSEMPYLAIQRELFRQWHKANSDQWDARYAPVKVSFKADIDLQAAEAVFESDVNVSDIARKVTEVKRFTIKAIEIRNFRTIKELKLDILPSDSLSEKESWLLLLGDNGIGKSSILQAIALTLCGKDEIKKLIALHDISPEDYLRRGEQEGYVKIFSYEQEEPVSLFFDAKEFRAGIDASPTFLLGYGSTRLLPKGKLQANDEALQDVNIGNLFDYTVALTNVNDWLKTVDPAEFDQRIAPALFDLLDMRGEDEKVMFTNGKLCLTEGDANLDIERNSDGYKSIVALACDMMRTLSRDSAGYHTVQGIVLIDELGNHLHPRWRMKIATALRKAFPRLQFIVSTHEPLCLRGLLHGEVVVLVEDEKAQIRALDKSLLPDHNLLRVEQLLTSDLFGLINTLDSDVEKKYEDYYALLSKPKEVRTQDENQKIEKYTVELAEKENIGSSPQLQAFYQVINEEFAQNLVKEGFKTKTELKNETVANVKEMLNSKKLDWL